MSDLDHYYVRGKVLEYLQQFDITIKILCSDEWKGQVARAYLLVTERCGVDLEPVYRNHFGDEKIDSLFSIGYESFCLGLENPSKTINLSVLCRFIDDGYEHGKMDLEEMNNDQ